jgi:RNA 2',3'-cyclic 3'-phosphodiesterase
VERSAPYKQRLFVALELPELARAHIVAWQSEILGHHGRELRLVKPEALHVTIAFLGWVAADPIGLIREAAFNGAGHDAPLLEAIGVNAVPPRRPRLWALSLADHGGRAAQIYEGVADKLEAGGFYKREKRPFWPHITVARLRAGTRSRQVHVPPPPIRFAPEEIVLYRSHLTRAGAEYERIAAMSLTSPTA